jgi:acid stress-induced BolA-like protein IbaG/YrbA
MFNKQPQQAIRAVLQYRANCQFLKVEGEGQETFMAITWKVTINSPMLLKRNITFIKKLHKRILSDPVKHVLSYQLLHYVLNNLSLK